MSTNSHLENELLNLKGNEFIRGPRILYVGEVHVCVLAHIQRWLIHLKN